MSQAAALFLTAHECSEDSTTQAAKHYYMGMRDAFQAIFMCHHGLTPDSDVETHARTVLGSLDDDDRRAVLDAARAVLRDARRESIAGTVVAL